MDLRLGLFNVNTVMMTTTPTDGVLRQFAVRPPKYSQVIQAAGRLIRKGNGIGVMLCPTKVAVYSTLRYQMPEF